MLKIAKNLSVLLLASFVVTGCGGGGTSKDNSNSNSSGFVGVAFKGAISGGKVICYDKDGKPLEQTKTDSDGNFKLKERCPDKGKLVVRGGTDKSTGGKIEELTAPGDSKSITPVTTMEYVSKRYGINLDDTDSKELVEGSKTINPSHKNEKSQKLIKMGLVLDSMTKNLQQQSEENLSYEEAMKIIAQKMKSKKIKDFADDKKKSEAKKILDEVFQSLETDGEIKIFSDNKNKIKDIINEDASSLQNKDLERDGLVKFIPPSLRERLPLRYVIISQEKVDGKNYKLKFERNPKYTKIDNLEYQCKIFTKPSKAHFTYRSDWSTGTNVVCDIDKEFTISDESVNAGKFLIIKYSKKDSPTKIYGYSVPHKIGSMVSYGNRDELTFNNKVYLPIVDGSTKTYVEKDITTGLKNASAISNLKTGKLGYLPVGFYYKPTKVPSDRFTNTAFGVKLSIGKKDLIMMVDRLYVAENSLQSASATNPYLHGIGSTSDKVLSRSIYNYYSVNGIYTRQVLTDLNRVDYHIKNGFLRFKAPTENDDALKINNQSTLTGNLVGISLADICNRKISLGKKATMCDYIRSTINAEQASKVTITPFIKATKRGSGIFGENLFKTSGEAITVRGIKDFESFPPLVIKGTPVAQKRLIPGQSGLKGVDSDGDGISDYDEMQLNRDPFNSVDTNVDTDKDGLTDLEEIELGMRPNSNVDRVHNYVTPLVLKVSEDHSDYQITVGSNYLGRNVKRYISISMEGGADKVVDYFSINGSRVATGTDIVFVRNTLYIGVKTKKNFEAGIIKPKIVITPKISKLDGSNAMTITRQIKKTLLESDDFSDSLKPDSVTLSYRVSVGGSKLDLKKSPLMVGAEITATPTDTDKPVGATDKFQWQNSNYGVDWRDISSATTSKYVIKSSDEGKFIRVKVAYLERGKATPDWLANTSAIVRNSDRDMVSVKPATPTVKPTMTSDEKDNTKFYPGSRITMTTTDKPGYVTFFTWKLDGRALSDLTKMMHPLFKSVRFARNTSVGSRIKVCYAYGKNRSLSDYLCSDEITLEKRGGTIRSINFKTGASPSSPTITKLTTNAGRGPALNYALNDTNTVLKEVFVLVKLPSVMTSKATTTGASLILTNGTDDIEASAYNSVYSAVDADNIFRNANKSTAVFRLDDRHELKSGKTYTVKSVTIPNVSYNLPTTKPTLAIEFVGWGTNSGPYIDNNSTPYRKLVGDTLTVVDTRANDLGIVKSYQWQTASYNKNTGCPYNTDVGWTNITGATANTYLIKSADRGKCVRITVALQIDSKPSPKVYKALKQAVSNVLVAPEAPTVAPTLTSSENDNTKFHKSSTITMHVATKAGYSVVGYKWKDNYNRLDDTITVFTDIIGATARTYKIPAGFKNGKKILGCYAYKIAGSDAISDYKCMQESDAKTITSK